MEWLMKMLQGGAGGGAGPFGALGGSSGPAANNGMPISGLGPGAPLNLQPGNPGQSPGLLAALAQKFGGGGQPQSSQGTQSGSQSAALNQAMNLIKQPQLQPAPWMQMMPMGTMRG